MPSFENVLPPFTNENHYVTCDMMLARDLHGNWLAKAFILMTSQSSERLVFKILIVEDNRSFREALSTSLQAHFPKLTLMKAARIQEARAKVESMQPDLIFVDLRLPDGDGLDFTRSIRAAGNKSVIIILTSHDLPEYREAAFNSGADHFMVKGSVEMNDIFAVVESILASRSGKRPRSGKRRRS